VSLCGVSVCGAVLPRFGRNRSGALAEVTGRAPFRRHFGGKCLPLGVVLQEYLFWHIQGVAAIQSGEFFWDAQ